MADKSTVKLNKARLPEGMRIYAIGDIHGCRRELKALLKLIRKDLKNKPVDHHRLIFVGDYVDRGPDSKGVIDLLIKMKKRGAPVTCLMGNHEEKLIRAFTDIDRRKMSGFTKYGGLETLASYGLEAKTVARILGDKPGRAEFEKFSRKVRKHLGKKHMGFLAKLKTHTQEGDYFFCHAGVNPQRSLAEQEPVDLIWIREPFLSWEQPLEKVIVHGHTPRNRPQERDHRINIDTACVYGETLTAVVLEGKKHRYLQVPAKKNYRGGD